MSSEPQNHVPTGIFRSKRARYTSRACKDCQRRKVKCDGRTPCARCAGHSLNCIYSTLAYNNHRKVQRDTATKRRDNTIDKELEHTTSPDDSSSNATVRKSTGFSIAPLAGNSVVTRRQDLALHRSPPEFSTNSPEFCGPTSIEYTFNAVNGNLRARGMQSVIPDKHSGSGMPTSSSSRLAQYGPFMKLLTMDPLWDMTREDAQVMIDDWCSGLGTVYPILSRRTMLDTADKIFHSLNLSHSEGLRERGGAVAEALFDHNTNKLKIILAIGMTKEAGGREHQAQRLFQSTSEAVEGLIWNPEGIHGIQLLFLVAMYHYHLNEEVRTGRCIAFAARLCLEAGWHRRTMLEKIFPDSEEYSEALQAFWAVYMLERRLSLGQGIPFSIQDSYIDRTLYAVDVENPLLATLLQWTKLAGKTWHALNNQTEKSYEARAEDISFLDFQIMEWYDSLPEHLKMPDVAIWTKDSRRLPTYYNSILFVRKAHLRTLIYRPVLQSPVQSRQNEPIVLKAIEIAKETIRTLFHLNEHTALIRTHPMFFQQLLLTGLGNLLLAIVSTGPRIRTNVREEFDMFLHLFQLLSSDNTVLRRTWQRLQGLRDLHARLSHSDRSTHMPHVDSGGADLGDDTAVTLSFDDIFPEMPILSAMVGAADTCGQSTTDTRVLPDFNYAPEDFFDSENLFDFPFLNLPSFM